MKVEDIMLKRKVLKTIKSCPKCHNTKGIISIPGTGTIFYFCPKCDKQNKKKEKIWINVVK